MRSQALQVALIVALGAGAGLLILRPWHSDADAPAPSVSPEPERLAHTPMAIRQEPVLRASTPSDADAPPPARTFKLPAITTAPAVAEVKPKEKERVAKAPPPAPLLVPKDWLLRGSAPQSYDVRSDRTDVLAGQASVLMAAHDKDVAYTQFASLMQSAAAGPWVGKRIEFSANVKMLDRWAGRWEIWVRALDAGNVVIAYDEAQISASRIEWRKGTAIIDVPWSAAEIAYGVNVHGVGKMYVDDTHLKVLDKSMPVPMRDLPGKLGVVAQDASKNGPLAMPSNLDFEDIVPADETFRELPKDRLDRSRF